MSQHSWCRPRSWRHDALGRCRPRSWRRDALGSMCSGSRPLTYLDGSPAAAALPLLLLVLRGQFSKLASILSLGFTQSLLIP